VSFDLGYQLPDQYIAAAEPRAEPAAPSQAPPRARARWFRRRPRFTWEMLSNLEDAPLWVRIWESKIASIAVLVVMLGC
jgi:transcriptional regulator of nitric oxide reductase